MHEFGIVQTWLAAAREAAGGRPIAALRVRVGALSGVEPDALAFAFEAAAPSARLDVETVPATRRCDACSAVFPFPGNGPACPSCGSARATWRSGFELELVSATLAEPLSSGPSNPSSPPPTPGALPCVTTAAATNPPTPTAIPTPMPTTTATTTPPRSSTSAPPPSP